MPLPRAQRSGEDVVSPALPTQPGVPKRAGGWLPPPGRARAGPEGQAGSHSGVGRAGGKRGASGGRAGTDPAPTGAVPPLGAAGMPRLGAAPPELSPGLSAKLPEPPGAVPVPGSAPHPPAREPRYRHGAAGCGQRPRCRDPDGSGGCPGIAFRGWGWERRRGPRLLPGPGGLRAGRSREEPGAGAGAAAVSGAAAAARLPPPPLTLRQPHPGGAAPPPAPAPARPRAAAPRGAQIWAGMAAPQLGPGAPRPPPDPSTGVPTPAPGCRCPVVAPRSPALSSGRCSPGGLLRAGVQRAPGCSRRGSAPRQPPPFAQILPGSVQPPSVLLCRVPVSPTLGTPLSRRALRPRDRDKGDGGDTGTGLGWLLGC